MLATNISNFDNGYFSAANLQYLGTNELDGYIADSKQASTGDEWK